MLSTDQITPLPPSELVELEIHVDPAEVRRYLGYPRARRPAFHVATRINELWPLAESLVRPRGALRLVDRVQIAPSGMPRPSAQVAVGLCTIGAELEGESDHRIAAGEPLDAVILDAFGSAAAESAAEELAARACARAAEHGLRAERRISPGYGRWPVSAQPALFALLPARELGISLSPGLMMIPRKSVSFVTRLRHGSAGDLSSPTRRGSPCRACRKNPCPFRQGDGA